MLMYNKHMTRTQIQLPDSLYRRAKRFGEEKELSLAEMTRRGLELFLDRYPDKVLPESGTWKLPQVGGGGVKVRLEKLRDILAEDQEAHGMRNLDS